MTTVWDMHGITEALTWLVAEQTLSAGEIARKLNKDFGTKLTRNAVCGKIFRAGLRNAPPVRKPSRRLRLSIVSRQSVPEPKPLGDVEGGCRFPHGEPRARLFCGAPTVELTSYCQHHYCRCYQVQPARLVSEAA